MILARFEFNSLVNTINTACWVKISADNIYKYFSYFPRK